MPTAATLTVSLGACMPRPSTCRGRMVNAAPVPATVLTNRRRVMSVMVLALPCRSDANGAGIIPVSKLIKPLTKAPSKRLHSLPGMTHEGRSAARAFLASFLVLFLEVALIRWMPAYVRLLAYFSNFILLASFLGIGIGCLLAARRFTLFRWFPRRMAAVVAAVYFFRLEVAVADARQHLLHERDAPRKSSRSRARCCCRCCSSIVAALFATQLSGWARDGGASAARRLHRQHRRQPRRRRRRSRCISWLELPPVVWFGVAFARRCRSSPAPNRTARGRVAGTAHGLPRHRAARRQPRPHPRDGPRRALVPVLQDHGHPAGGEPSSR